MDLDNLSEIVRLDRSNYYNEILNFPEHLHQGLNLSQENTLDFNVGEIHQVLISGMGGSAIGGDLAAACVRSQCMVPVFSNRDYELPAWAEGGRTLVIASSHSGNTEETLSCYHQAKERGCRILAISTGGELERLAISDGVDFWKFIHSGQPRAAVGFSLGWLLGIFFRLELIDDPTPKIQKSIDLVKKESEKFILEAPVSQNPAKRFAGQMIGRIPVCFGSDYLTPVARRFKTQINELSKSWAQFEFLPEADHNTAAGVAQPDCLPAAVFALFLECVSDHPRNRLRSKVTRENLLLEGVSTDFYLVPGETPLENICAGVQFCDFTAFYLAVACGEDPTPIPGINAIKQSLMGK
jgi:glucose/mannose-6-phosphate isomerase